MGILHEPVRLGTIVSPDTGLAVRSARPGKGRLGRTGYSMLGLRSELPRPAAAVDSGEAHPG